MSHGIDSLSFFINFIHFHNDRFNLLVSHEKTSFGQGQRVMALPEESLEEFEVN